MTSIAYVVLASLVRTGYAVDHLGPERGNSLLQSTSTSHRELQTPADDQCQLTFFNGTRVIFDDGESFGNLITTACGSSDEFPCFCASQTENDGVRCPYCSFDAIGGETVCARDGGSVEFVDPDGMRQECSCEYVANSIVNVSCRTIDIPPPQECFLERNLEQCADVTESTSPIEDCDCYNYCNGEFSGCCKLGDSCQSTCVTGGTVVAGCRIDPNKQPVVTPAPTPAPVVDTGFCGISLNTENCADLLRDQTPVQGCDCYNFCGDELVGCCDFGVETDCNVSCSGRPAGTVFTFGCILESGPPQPTCLTFFESCSSNTECCSGRCSGGICRSSVSASAGKRGGLKLSGTRGGAGGGSPRRPGSRSLAVSYAEDEAIVDNSVKRRQNGRVRGM